MSDDSSKKQIEGEGPFSAELLRNLSYLTGDLKELIQNTDFNLDEYLTGQNLSDASELLGKLRDYDSEIMATYNQMQQSIPSDHVESLKESMKQSLEKLTLQPLQVLYRLGNLFKFIEGLDGSDWLRPLNLPGKFETAEQMTNMIIRSLTTV